MAWYDYLGYAAAPIAYGLYDSSKERQAQSQGMQERLGGYETRFQGLSDSYGNRGIPQAQGFTAADSAVRNNQLGLMNQLELQSRGLGPSVSQQQLRMATDQNTATQASLAAGARGNPALAQRNASNAAASVGAQAAGQAALGRIQEQMSAQQQLAGLTGQIRGQDIGLGQFNATQQQGNSQFNVNATLQGQGQNQQGQMQALMAAYQAAVASGQIQAGTPLTSEAFLAFMAQAAPYALGKPGGG
jgi:hypothetical protein